jgi:hypothetical protein
MQALGAEATDRERDAIKRRRRKAREQPAFLLCPTLALGA